MKIFEALDFSGEKVTGEVQENGPFRCFMFVSKTQKVVEVVKSSLKLIMET